MKLNNQLLFFGFFFFYSFQVSSTTFPILNIDEVKVYDNIHQKHVGFIKETNQSFSIQDFIQQKNQFSFNPLPEKLPFSKEVYWLHFQFQVKTPEMVNPWILDIGKADEIDVYFVNQNGDIIHQEKVGELVPMSLKSLKRKYPIERIPFSITQTAPVDVYIRFHRMNGARPELQMALHQRDFYERKSYIQSVLYSYLFYGMFFTICFLGLGVYAAIKEKTILYFGLIFLNLGCYLVDANFQIIGNYIFRETPHWEMYLVYALVTAMNISHINFIRYSLLLKQKNLKLDYWAKALGVLNGVMLLVVWGIYFFTTDEFFTNQIFVPFIMLTYFCLLGLFYKVMKSGENSIENILLYISTILFVLAVGINGYSIMNGTYLKLLETQLIVFLVLIVFSISVLLSLMYRYRRYEREKFQLAKVKELNEIKASFYQNVTHEFRTPLTVISGMIQELKGKLQPKLNSDTDKMISSIQRNSKLLLGLVNDLLEVAKMNQSSKQLNIKQEDIVGYLRYIVQSMESYATTKEIRLQFVSEIITLEMGFDEEKLRQVIYNLISNAIKFSKDNQEVNIFLRKEKYANQEGIIISVQDRGMGITKEDIPFVIDRFYQGGHQNKNIIGSGIGLSIVKKWIDLMNGKIWVESVVSKGTLMKVFLPIKKEFLPLEKGIAPLSTLEKVKDSSTKKTTNALVHKERSRILIVEDNIDIIDYIELILKNEYDIQVAKNGKIGVEMAQQDVPDLIISDVMMPEMDGYELCGIVKKDIRTSHIPVILLTAKSTHQDKLTGLQQGADSYLMKPFEKKELLLVIHNLLENRKKLQTYILNKQDIPNENNPISLSKQEDEFLQKLKTFIEEHILDENIEMGLMQKKLAMSRAQIYRKLKALTGLSIGAYRKHIRLHQAKRLIQSQQLPIEEVALQVGYNNVNQLKEDLEK
jgi:signal transduction histidine kinase/DNA-binding response OmpR family regulator